MWIGRCSCCTKKTTTNPKDTNFTRKLYFSKCSHLFSKSDFSILASSYSLGSLKILESSFIKTTLLSLNDSISSIPINLFVTSPTTQILFFDLQYFFLHKLNFLLPEVMFYIFGNILYTFSVIVSGLSLKLK